MLNFDCINDNFVSDPTKKKLIRDKLLTSLIRIERPILIVEPAEALLSYQFPFTKIHGIVKDILKNTAAITLLNTAGLLHKML